MAFQSHLQAFFAVCRKNCVLFLYSCFFLFLFTDKAGTVLSLHVNKSYKTYKTSGPFVYAKDETLLKRADKYRVYSILKKRLNDFFWKGLFSGMWDYLKINYRAHIHYNKGTCNPVPSVWLIE